MNTLLIETCLLTHGISSITDENLFNKWPAELQCMCWLESGNIIISGIEDLIKFRHSKNAIYRIDHKLLPDALKQKKSGALTASGTMAVCKLIGADIAISCGIGGLISRHSKTSSDIEALINIDIPLFATAFKDMFDTYHSINYLLERNIPVLGYNTCSCTGYILNGKKTQIAEYDKTSTMIKGLLLNPIHPSNRLKDYSLLKTCVDMGLKAEQNGEAFHPAVNKAFDDYSGGRSSQIQLDSLIQNALSAKSIHTQRG